MLPEAMSAISGFITVTERARFGRACQTLFNRSEARTSQRICHARPRGIVESARFLQILFHARTISGWVSAAHIDAIDRTLRDRINRLAANGGEGWSSSRNSRWPAIAWRFVAVLNQRRNRP